MGNVVGMEMEDNPIQIIPEWKIEQAINRMLNIDLDHVEYIEGGFKIPPDVNISRSYIFKTIGILFDVGIRVLCHHVNDDRFEFIGYKIAS